VGYEILQWLVILLGPLPLQYYLKDTKLGKVLSPIVVAYAIGIKIATFDIFPITMTISKPASEISVMIAIPLLLFGADIIGWFRHARSTVLSFFYAILAAFISVVLFGFVFNGHIDHVWDYSGMLIGVYTGGTATMQAVGVAVDASDETFALINSVEILVGGIYLLFLTSVAPAFFGSFLKKYKPVGDDVEEYEEEIFSWTNWKQMMIAFGLSLLILGITIGLSFAVFGNMENSTFIIIVLTTISVASSFIPGVGKLKGSFDIAEYLLLVFSIAAGMRSDFGDIIDKGGMLLLYTACTWVTVVVIHTLLSWISRIDRDTTMITSTAALYGPAFIGQIASVLDNRRIVIAGMATGIMGYAVGNYLGIAVQIMLKNFLA